MQDRNLEGIEQYVSGTVTALKGAANDEHRLKQLCADIAKSADGVFLWARFAVSEVIGSYAKGDTTSELKRRLGDIPSDMEEIYARIFRRMSTNDRDEARLAFQLVCFALRVPKDSYRETKVNKISRLTILQLNEAIAVVRKCTTDSIHDCGVDSVQDFRKRIRARGGGLLEEIPTTTKKSEAWEVDTSDFPGDDDHTDPKGWTIKLIHRTIASYLEREGWLSGWQIGNQYFHSPDALWLYICCKCVQTTWESSALLASRRGYPRLSSENILKRFSRHSLVKYASSNLFHHARCIEQQPKNQESSYAYLSLVTPETWRYLRAIYRTRDLRTTDGFPGRDWQAVEQGSNHQPWQIVVEQGLALCCRDLVENNLYKPSGHGQEIALAMSTALSSRMDPQAVDVLIRLLVDFGRILSRKNILECLYIGTASTLEALLDAWPKGAVQLNRGNLLPPFPGEDVRETTYAGENVGPLWELVRSRRSEFEPMLDLLLERGERLDQSCGPGGTMLHAIIFRTSTDAAYEHVHRESLLNKVKRFLDRKVNVNVRIFRIESFVTGVWVCLRRALSIFSLRYFVNLFYDLESRIKEEAESRIYKAPGPRGTPLQFAWRLFHSPMNPVKRTYLRDLMALLMDYGADTDWTEPNGIIVNEATIRAWCALSDEQIKSQSKFDYAFCKAGWYIYEYPLYCNEIDARRYRDGLSLDRTQELAYANKTRRREPV